MIEIRIDASELTKMAGRVRGLSSGERSSMLREIGAQLVDREQERISSDKFSPDGEQWAPWSDSYHRSGRGLTLLENTGRLRRSLRSFQAGGTLAVEAFAPYAGFIQHGTRKMPARPFLGWGPEEIEIAESVARETLQGALW